MLRPSEPSAKSASTTASTAGSPTSPSASAAAARTTASSVREQGDERFDRLFLRDGGDRVCRYVAHSGVRVVEPGQRKVPCLGSAGDGDRAVPDLSNRRIRRVHDRVEHGLRALFMLEEDRGGERADRDLLVVEHFARRVYTGAGKDPKSGKAHR